MAFKLLRDDEADIKSSGLKNMVLLGGGKEGGHLPVLKTSFFFPNRSEINGGGQSLGCGAVAVRLVRHRLVKNIFILVATVLVD